VIGKQPVPKGRLNPTQTCGRLIAGAFCGSLAEWHVLWDDELDNAICCQRHFKEAAETWRIKDAHQYRFPCTQPKALWSFDDHCCVLPDEEGTTPGRVAAVEQPVSA
jgi:hypothetical protein